MRRSSNMLRLGRRHPAVAMPFTHASRPTLRSLSDSSLKSTLIFSSSAPSATRWLLDTKLTPSSGTQDVVVRSALQEHVTLFADSPAAVSVAEVPDEEVIEVIVGESEAVEVCAPQVIDVSIEGEADTSQLLPQRQYVKLRGKLEGDSSVMLLSPGLKCVSENGAVGGIPWPSFSEPGSSSPVGHAEALERMLYPLHAARYRSAVKAEKLRGESITLVSGSSSMEAESSGSQTDDWPQVEVTSLVESTEVRIAAASVHVPGQSASLPVVSSPSATPLVAVHKLLAERAAVLTVAALQTAETPALLRIGSAYARDLRVQAKLSCGPSSPRRFAAARVGPLSPMVRIEQLHGTLHLGASVSAQAAEASFPLVVVDNISGSVHVDAALDTRDGVAWRPAASCGSSCALIRLHFDDLQHSNGGSDVTLSVPADLAASASGPLVEITFLAGQAAATDASMPSGSFVTPSKPGVRVQAELHTLQQGQGKAEAPMCASTALPFVTCLDAQGRNVDADEASVGSVATNAQDKHGRTGSMSSFLLPLVFTPGASVASSAPSAAVNSDAPSASTGFGLASPKAISISGKIGAGAASTASTFYSPARGQRSELNLRGNDTPASQPALRIKVMLTGNGAGSGSAFSGPLVAVRAVSWLDKVRAAMENKHSKR